MKSRRIPWGWAALMLSEAFSALVGFFVLVRLARLLGPSSFSGVEYATAVAAVMLVWVRGGVETIVHREAARCPRLIVPLSETLLIAKLVLAIVGFASIVLFGLLTNGVRLGVLVAAGLILVPSAFCLDVGPRARCELPVIAAVQLLRAVVLGLVSCVLVAGPGDEKLALISVVTAETIATIAFGIVHFRRFGPPRFRVKYRAIRILLARGTITSLSRFLRVFLYSADLLILGTLQGSTDLGPFATARRVVFAILGLGLVIPATIGPMLAKNWPSRPSETRRSFASTTSTILGPALAASLGLSLTASGWMTALFGSADGSTLLILFALRLPLMMLAALVIVGLVACRRERESLVILTTACGLAIVGISVVNAGPIGAACVMLAVESFVVGVGWPRLWLIGAAPKFPTIERTDMMAIVVMGLVVANFSQSPVWAVSSAGAVVYATVRLGSKWAATVSLPKRMEAAR